MSLKISINKVSLERELSRFRGILPSKSSLEATLYILLEASESGKLRMSASDLDISFVSEIPCEVASPGSIALKGASFLSAVHPLKSDSLKLEVQANQYAQLTSSRTKARLVGLDPAEFPETHSGDFKEIFKVPTIKMLSIVEQTLPFISRSADRINITGGFMRLNDKGQLSLVTTDSYRMARVITTLEAPAADLPDELVKGVIIPRKGLEQLAKIVSSEEEFISVGLEGNRIVFAWGDSQLAIQLMDGGYPNLDNLIATYKVSNETKVPRKELIDGMQYVATFAPSTTSAARISYEGDVAKITAQDSEVGEAEWTLGISDLKSDVATNFNVHYLLDALKVMKSDTIIFDFGENRNPGVLLETEADDGDDSIFIVMPTQVAS